MSILCHPHIFIDRFEFNGWCGHCHDSQLYFPGPALILRLSAFETALGLRLIYFKIPTAMSIPAHDHWASRPLCYWKLQFVMSCQDIILCLFSNSCDHLDVVLRMECVVSSSQQPAISVQLTLTVIQKKKFLPFSHPFAAWVYWAAHSSGLMNNIPVCAFWPTHPTASEEWYHTHYSLG